MEEVTKVIVFLLVWKKIKLVSELTFFLIDSLGFRGIVEILNLAKAALSPSCGSYHQTISIVTTFVYMLRFCRSNVLFLQAWVGLTKTTK
jgi:hypothetical protein